jgi:hypothetical protein
MPISDEALDAAAIALSIQGVYLKDKIRPNDLLSDRHLRIVLTSMLEAALPHLVAPTTDRRAYDVGRDAILAEATRTPIPDQGERDAGYFECCESWGGHSEDCAAGES